MAQTATILRHPRSYDPPYHLDSSGEPDPASSTFASGHAGEPGSEDRYYGEYDGSESGWSRPDSLASRYSESTTTAAKDISYQASHDPRKPVATYSESDVVMADVNALFAECEASVDTGGPPRTTGIMVSPARLAKIIAESESINYKPSATSAKKNMPPPRNPTSNHKQHHRHDAPRSSLTHRHKPQQSTPVHVNKPSEKHYSHDIPSRTSEKHYSYDLPSEASEVQYPYDLPSETSEKQYSYDLPPKTSDEQFSYDKPPRASEKQSSYTLPSRGPEKHYSYDILPSPEPSPEPVANTRPKLGPILKQKWTGDKYLCPVCDKESSKKRDIKDHQARRGHYYKK